MVYTQGTVEIDYRAHSTLKFKDSDGNVIWVDPWSDVLNEQEEKADIIVSTHDDFDHFDKKAIQKLKKQNTVLVCSKESNDDAPKELHSKIIEPNSSVKVRGKRFKGVHAYNIKRTRENGQPFHPKGSVTGLVFKLDGQKFYFASDTDLIPEMQELETDIDIAFLPIGGTYTMDIDEAVEAAKKIGPSKAVPVHYNVVEGTEADPEEFRSKLEETDVEPVIL